MSSGSLDSICLVPSEAYPSIQNAINDPGCEDVQIGSGIFTETVTISRTISVHGQSTKATIINGSGIYRGFEVLPGANVTITDMTIESGLAITGGGILNDRGNLSIHRIILRKNRAGYPVTCSQIGGGAIYNREGILKIAHSMVIENSAIGYTVYGNCVNSGLGGGVYNDHGSISIHNSLFEENAAGGTTFNQGGGIYNDFGIITITNSTLSNNFVGYGGVGGGISSHGGVISITFSTLNNYVPNLQPIASAANIFNSTADGGNVFLQNSIFTNNSELENCTGTITSHGYNLENGDSCNLISAGDVSNTNPLIWDLQDNNGDTLTQGLITGSPAVNKIPVGINGCGTDVQEDQRGAIRPEGLKCDIGAFEGTLTFQIYIPLLFRN